MQGHFSPFVIEQRLKNSGSAFLVVLLMGLVDEVPPFRKMRHKLYMSMDCEYDFVFCGRA